ncbi:hypothetical protein NLG97_g285 [Lecanicillium saksenae]|uniref:Uncharacterized protein n=1 Tax=Lecanicillium saksenae TaxID=468837 RepID=A0ACC1R8H2_9HYPO|nr:hypothetical protein NLG97_g285 [Lecanicillium saksenae]
MSFCKHTAWLRVWKRGDQVTLEASDRTGRLLRHVRQEEPIGVVVFIGHQRKYGVLSSLQLRSRSARARKSHGEIHLDVAHITRNQQMLIVDGDLPKHGQLPRTQGAFSCHEVASKQYTAAPQPAASVSDSIYHRALFPLTDVVCLFAEDIGGLDCALQHLAAWNGQGPSSTARISPAILLVVDRGQEAKAKAKLRAEKLQRPHGWFHMIRVVSIDREAHRSSNRRQAKSYQSLSMEISRLIRSAQTERRRASLLFSARHVLEFLRIAAARTVEECWTPLDFVQASRLFDQVDENIESHILNLASQFEHQDDVADVAAPLVASSFLLNHYVPDMHDFDPTAVFGSLYQQPCENVASVIAAHRDEAGLRPMATDFPSLILHNFCVLYKKLKQHNGSIDVHRKQLAHTHRRGLLPSSEDTCFGCLQRRPQHCLPCGHWLCQVCVRIFYDECPDEPWLYNVDTCVICGLATDQHRIRIKPDTADPCVLSIDGGGARGRGPLEFLRILEETIGLPFPVQRHFDVVFGTSSGSTGAMTACALCLNGWPVDYCIDFFELSSRLAFDSNRLSRIVAFLVGDVPIVSPLLQALSSLLVDSKYSAKKLESIQKDAYGESRSIVDSNAASEMGISLGVTLTTTGDASTYIATNYNGVGCRDGVTDYAHLTFGGGTRNVPLWEILRCCTAAPYYFTPHHIAGTGTFQDGGLAFNNPAAIALRESEALFPAAAAPRVVVSLGTGSADPKRSGDQASLWDGLFAARLFRAFWKQSDSGAAWDQLVGHQTSDRGAEFFRFDIAFGEQAPSLDDVRGMDEVARLARESVLASTEMRRLSSCLRAGLFFFELDGSSLPIMRRGTYYCTGKLQCRLRAGSDELRALLGQLYHSSAVF